MDLSSLQKVLKVTTKDGIGELGAAQILAAVNAGNIQKMDLAVAQDRLLNERTIAKQPPSIKGSHPPSTADLSSLTFSEYSDLEAGERHESTAILLRIHKVDCGLGVWISASDTVGTPCNVWSLVRSSFAALRPNSWIAIKEPFLGTSPDDVVCIRLDHPTDAVLIYTHGERGHLLRDIESG
jgi:hypothetical protein